MAYNRKCSKTISFIACIAGEPLNFRREINRAVQDAPIDIFRIGVLNIDLNVRIAESVGLKMLAESGGMLGFSAYPVHLKNGSDCTLVEFCEMAARTADLRLA